MTVMNTGDYICLKLDQPGLCGMELPLFINRINIVLELSGVINYLCGCLVF